MSIVAAAVLLVASGSGPAGWWGAPAELLPLDARTPIGETIAEALRRAKPLEARGFRYSYDMLGEAARTEADARRYHLAYSKAITAIAAAASSGTLDWAVKASTL